MRSTAEHLLVFFDWYIENEIAKDLKKFYINITEELYFKTTDEIDKLNHVVKVLNIHHQEQTKSKDITFSFEGFIKSKLKLEMRRTTEFIELGFGNLFPTRKKSMRMLLF